MVSKKIEQDAGVTDACKYAHGIDKALKNANKNGDFMTKNKAQKIYTNKPAWSLRNAGVFVDDVPVPRVVLRYTRATETILG